jgi:hypothetical protein
VFGVPLERVFQYWRSEGSVPWHDSRFYKPYLPDGSTSKTTSCQLRPAH